MSLIASEEAHLTPNPLFKNIVRPRADNLSIGSGRIYDWGGSNLSISGPFFSPEATAPRPPFALLPDGKSLNNKINKNVQQ